MEKNKGLCRRECVIPSIRDAIVLQRLSDTFYDCIRSKAPTNKSFYQPKEHRFSANRDQYGSYFAWLNRQKELFKFSKERNFVVVTDIANSYALHMVLPPF